MTNEEYYKKKMKKYARYAEEAAGSYFMTKKGEKKMTNAERIRNMTNEELAESRIDRIDIYCRSDTQMWVGDFAGIAESKEEALQLEKEWLESECDAGIKIEAETVQKTLNPYGEYVLKFAKNHNISIAEAYEQPMVKARYRFFSETGM